MIAPVRPYPLPTVKTEARNVWPFMKQCFDQLLEVYFYLALPLLSLLPLFGILSLQGEYVGKILWLFIQSPALLGIWRVMKLQLEQQEIEISDYIYFFRKENIKKFWPAYVIPHVLALIINGALGLLDGGFVGNLLSVTIAAALEVLILLLQVRIVFYSPLLSAQEILNWFKSEDFYKNYWKWLGLHDARIVALVVAVYYLGVLLALFPFFFVSLPLSFLILNQHLRKQVEMTRSVF